MQEYYIRKLSKREAFIIVVALILGIIIGVTAYRWYMARLGTMWLGPSWTTLRVQGGTPQEYVEVRVYLKKPWYATSMAYALYSAGVSIQQSQTSTEVVGGGWLVNNTYYNNVTASYTVNVFWRAVKPGTLSVYVYLLFDNVEKGITDSACTVSWENFNEEPDGSTLLSQTATSDLQYIGNNLQLDNTTSNNVYVYLVVSVTFTGYISGKSYWNESRVIVAYTVWTYNAELARAEAGAEISWKVMMFATLVVFMSSFVISAVVYLKRD